MSPDDNDSNIDNESNVDNSLNIDNSGANVENNSNVEKKVINSEEVAKARLAEKRREMKEKKEREAELERQRLVITNKELLFVPFYWKFNRKAFRIFLCLIWRSIKLSEISYISNHDCWVSNPTWW